MSDETKEEADASLRITMMPDETLVRIFDVLREAGQCEGMHEAYCEVLTALSLMKKASEEELARNQTSPIALAHVMLLTKTIATLAPVPVRLKRRAERHLAVLRTVFEQAGLVDPEDGKNDDG